MTKKEVRGVFDSDILDRMNSIIYYIKRESKENIKMEIRSVLRLVWTAESLGVITLEEWEILRSILGDLELRTIIRWEEVKKTTY